MEIVDLPAGWSKAVVGDYFFLKNGFAFKSNDYIPASDKSYPVIRISDLDGKIATDSNAVHVLDGAPGFEVRNGDLLIAMSGATTGKIGIYQGKEPAYQNQRVGNLKLHSEVNGCNDYKNYLVYFLSDDILKIAYGGAQPNISGKAIEEMKILLPPLAEQKVIAEKLDSLLAQVDNTKARLERIPDILKRFRQSVLAAAVSGKLTEGWRNRKTLNQLPDLIEKYTIDDKYSFTVPIVWKFTAIGNCSTFQQGLQIAKATRRTEPASDVLPILRTVNYENGFSVDIHYAVVDDKSIIAEPADIIISRTGTVGRVLTGYRGIMHNNSFRINYDKQLLLREYLIYFLKSPTCQEYVKENSGRSSQPDLTHKAFAKCPLALPSILEQTEIVRRVEELFAFADRIEQAAQAALSRVNSLTQSILAKAFRGELTADWRAANPELISGENGAEALLMRIKAERTALVGNKRGRKTVMSN